MQLSLEQLLVYFEEAFGCRITLHDPMHLLGGNREFCQLGECRMSHRRTFPTMCGQESREYCVEHCMFQFNKWVERTRHPLYIMHCRNGFWQLAVPIYRNNIHVFNMFAGLWRRFDDKVKIRRIARMLPVFAEGIIKLLESRKEQESQSSSTMVTRIHSFIGNNYNRPLETRDLARHLSLSISRTCAVVQEACHASFKRLLNQERVRHAKLYLEQSDMRIKEIALLCGFASPEHFVRTFQQFEKCTPGKWRNNKETRSKNGTD